MNFYFNQKGPFNAEAWVEDLVSNCTDWQVVSYAKLIIAKDKCFIDTIDTPLVYQGRGYATRIVKELQKVFFRGSAYWGDSYGQVFLG